jgi:hypothetical protein
MRQTLHIFAKDVRRFYPETLASLAVTFLFLKYYPQEWGAPGIGFRSLDWLPGAITALLIVTWWVLITRVIHAESLVGERQFWVTRPYRWPSLFAAKCLFIVAFVYVPFTAAQCVLLLEAGFHPSRVVPGILFNLAMATGIIVLPLMLLATLTSSFAKMLLAVFFVVILVAAIGYLSTLLPSSGSPDDGTWTMFVVYVSAVAAIIVWQYATRRTGASRWLVCGVAALMALLALCVPDNYSVEKIYPAHAANQPSVVELGFRAGDDRESSAAFDPDDKREVELSLPITISAIEKTKAIRVDFARVDIHADHGEHFQSHWQTEALTWLPGETGAVIRLKVSRPFFEQVKTLPVTIDLSLAITAVQMGKATRIIIPQGEFSIPHGGICARSGIWSNDLSCRYAMRQPPLMLIVTKFSTGACSGDKPEADGDEGLAWVGNLDPDPAEFGITSVWTNNVSFLRTSSENSSAEQHLCAGSTLGILPYRPMSRTRERLTTRAIGLEHLTTKLAM